MIIISFLCTYISKFLFFKSNAEDLLDKVKAAGFTDAFIKKE